MGLASLFEKRTAVPVHPFLRDDDLPGLTLAGVSMTQAKALALTAIYSAVRVIADPVSTFPVGTFIRVNGERKPFFPRPPWVDAPDPDPSVARSDHYQALMVSLLLNGNYYGRKLYDARGEVTAIRVLDPTRMDVRADPSTGMATFWWDNHKQIPATDVIHVTDLRKPGALKGSSRIDDLREPLGIGKALDEYVARYFGQGVVGQRMVLKVPGELTEDQAGQMKLDAMRRWASPRKAHEPIVVSGASAGGDVSVLGDNAEQAQLNAAREFFVTEVARAFKVPPSKLGVTTPGTRAFASVEQDNIDFATSTLRFYVSKIEEAYSGLLFPSQAFIRLNMDALLRGDISSRYTAFNQGIQAGFLTVADIRRTEDLSPIPGADVLRVPLESINIDAAGLVADQKRVEMLLSLVQSGATPQSAAAAVGLPGLKFLDLPSVQLQAPPAA